MSDDIKSLEEAWAKATENQRQPWEEDDHEDGKCDHCKADIEGEPWTSEADEGAIICHSCYSREQEYRGKDE